MFIYSSYYNWADFIVAIFSYIHTFLNEWINESIPMEDEYGHPTVAPRELK